MTDLKLRNRFLTIVAIFCAFLFSGCATTDVLKTPLKYGKEVSADAIELYGYDAKTVADALMKVNKREGKCGKYEIEKTSDNSFIIKVNEWINVFTPGVGASQLVGNHVQKKNIQNIFKVTLTTQDNSVILKAEKDKVLITATGRPLDVRSYYLYYTRTAIFPAAFTTGPDYDEVNKGLNSPVEKEMTGSDLQSCFKDLVLFLEKFLPKK
ncbi:hypothetical protein D4Q80_01330 [bacterium]|nr:MAG: hypothetical protein D4Q80_01330 [bacterium]